MDTSALTPLLLTWLRFCIAFVVLSGVGELVRRSLRIEVSSSIEQISLRAALGLAVGGTVWVLLGLAGMWNFWIVWGSIVLFSGYVLWSCWRARPEAAPAPPSANDRPVGWPWRLAGLIGWVLLVWSLWFSLTPNVLPDPMTHHFLVADLWAQAGRLTELPHVPYSYFPGLMQSFYAFGFVVGGEGVASLIGWSFAAQLIFAVHMVACRLWRPEAGIAAALVVLSWESYYKHLLGGWADTGIALFALIGLWLLWRGATERHQGALVGAGLCLGAAIACSKHTALLVATLATVGLVIAIVQSKGELKWRSLGALVGGIVAVAGVWYVRAYVLTGNPVYPLTFWGLFPGPEIAIYTETQWSHAGTARPWYWVLQQPWLITVGERDWPEAFQGRLPWSWLIGAPLAIRYGWLEPVVRWLLGLLCVTWLVMLTIAPYEVRYFLFAVPWIALLTGHGLTRLLDLTPRQVLPTAFCLLVLLIPLMDRWQPMLGESALRWPVLSGDRSAEDYVQKANHPAAIVHWCNAHLDPKAHRIFALEDRLYRLRIPWTTFFAQGRSVPSTADECLAYLQQAGATHLLLGEGHTWAPSVMSEVLRSRAGDDGRIWVTQQEVMRNLMGRPIQADKHWVVWVLFRRHAERAGWPTRQRASGVMEYGIPERDLTQDPAARAGIQVIRAFQQLIDRGDLAQEYSDGLNFVFRITQAPPGDRATLAP